MKISCFRLHGIYLLSFLGVLNRNGKYEDYGGFPSGWYLLLM